MNYHYRVTTLAVIAGFLGAGKTTLMLAAAERLRAAGKRVAIVTNDQGGELVDTRLARAAGFETGEVTDGCFCCRFSDLVRTVPEADIVFAEPVGSCTDLAATVLRPLQKLYEDRFRLAPLTVLIDPLRARRLLAPGADPNLAYLFRNQIAEADLVRFTKSDAGEAPPEIPGISASSLSARTGEGVGEWLEEVLAGAPGFRSLEIDYRIYADAEAALGWLNWEIGVRLDRALTPAALIGPLLEQLDARLTEAGAQIAHLKLFAHSAGGYIKASVCANGDEPSVEGRLDAPPSLGHGIALNLRAAGAPEELERIVEESVSALPGRVTVRHRQSFRPAAPQPEHRM